MKNQKQQINNQPQGEMWVLTCRHQQGEIYPGTSQHSCPVTIVTCLPGKPYQDQMVALAPARCSALITCIKFRGSTAFTKLFVSHLLLLGNRKCSVLSTLKMGRKRGIFFCSSLKARINRIPAIIQDNKVTSLVFAHGPEELIPVTPYCLRTVLRTKSLASLLPKLYKVKQRKRKIARTEMSEMQGGISWPHLCPLFQNGSSC